MPSRWPDNSQQHHEFRKMKRIILAGGSGFLGNALAKMFLAKNCEVAVLTRSPRERSDAAKEIPWDAKSPGEWTKFLDGADVVINLTGRSVDCRYTEKNRRDIISSRVDSTRAIGEAIARCANPPRVWLNASSATLYKHTFNRAIDENGEIGATPEAKDEFSIEVIRKWENALNEARTPRTRKIALRITLVFGADGGVFPVLRRLARFGLGGRMGNGRQIVSWIHIEDFCRAVEWIIEHENLSGPINLAAPNPVTNAEMMKFFRDACGAPFGLPATEWMLEIGAFFLRTETELILKSRNVVPGKLSASGFEFQFPFLRDAIQNLNRS
jgi:uncharacterized protein (TIGR01777 family)